MQMLASFKCPYCGHDNRRAVEKSGSSIVVCALQFGGCDQELVLDVDLKVQTKTRKISDSGSVILPAQLAEDAIDLFMECLGNVEDSGWSEVDAESVVQARAKAINEVVEGCNANIEEGYNVRPVVTGF